MAIGVATRGAEWFFGDERLKSSAPDRGLRRVPPDGDST
jgi:hypothetical protein